MVKGLADASGVVGLMYNRQLSLPCLFRYLFFLIRMSKCEIGCHGTIPYVPNLIDI